MRSSRDPGSNSPLIREGRAAVTECEAWGLIPVCVIFSCKSQLSRGTWDYFTSERDVTAGGTLSGMVVLASMAGQIKSFRRRKPSFVTGLFQPLRGWRDRRRTQIRHQRRQHQPKRAQLKYNRYPYQHPREYDFQSPCDTTAPITTHAARSTNNLSRLPV